MPDGRGWPNSMKASCRDTQGHTDTEDKALGWGGRGRNGVCTSQGLSQVSEGKRRGQSQ